MLNLEMNMEVMAILDAAIKSSRSGREDFVGLIELYKEHPEIVNYLENIVGSEITARGIKDIVLAFETDIHKLIGKTIIKWNE